LLINFGDNFDNQKAGRCQQKGVDDGNQKGRGSLQPAKESCFYYSIYRGKQVTVQRGYKERETADLSIMLLLDKINLAL